MKRTFLITGGVLALASIATMRSIPGQGGDLPVLHWVTDPHPARVEQIATYYEWLDRHDYPRMQVFLDAANAEITKKLIQGVSGVGGEIVDCNRAKRDLLVFHGVGMLEDVTDEAQALGFSTDQTYPSMEEAITVDGRQFGFPRNVSTFMFWVNRQTFDNLGMKQPPQVWDWAEFERVGKEFVARANAGANRTPAFFLLPDQTDQMALPVVMMRGLGQSLFNETMTASTLDDPRTIEVLETIHRWTFEERLLPTAADRASFTTSSGFGGPALQLFREGRVGMVMMGRYALLQLRRFDEPLQLAVSEPPAERYRNTLIMGGISSVYAGAENKELAAYFLAYLASEGYNMQIVRDADGLPPNPRFTETEAFLRPPEHPNEWGVHEVFANAAKEIAIPYDYNEFILPTATSRILDSHYEAFMNGLIDAPTAAYRMQRDLDAEIQRNLRDRPQLAEKHARLLAAQREIDALKQAGEPVPASLLRNPYHLALQRRADTPRAE
ncbi:MAG: ABC transporter substrate-binding protein [Verrucomicrobiota bacterium JB022]|nr:ABC transporter substrate-binding protein [Verrucomicrobiota bacterium JB022]